MKRSLLLCSVLVLCAATASAQKEDKAKPWTEWSEKEAMKMLTDSAWAQTQKELSDMGSSSGPAITTAAENKSTIGVVGKDAAAGGESGQTVGQKSQSLSMYYYVSFMSAKPVRQAFIRYLEVKHPETPADKLAERRKFVDTDFSDYIVVTLRLEGSDRKKIGQAMQLLGASTPATLKDVAYLERKDGKRLPLMDYRAPGPDGMGAKFIFPRTLDGQPFVDANSGEVRVYMEINKTKLTRKFKVADMIYDGKLEY